MEKDNKNDKINNGQEKCELKVMDEVELDIRNSINKIIVNKGLTSYNVKINKISTNGRSVRNLYEVFIEGVIITKDKGVNLFIKKYNENNIAIKTVLGNDMYLREIFIYTEFSKIITDLQNKFKIPNDEKFKTVKFYDAFNFDTLIMENMRTKGYKLFDRKQAIPLRFAEIAVKELAKFHSLSFILEQANPKCYRDHIRTKNNIMNYTEDFISWNASLYNGCIQVLYTEDARIKIADFCDQRMEKYTNYYKTTDNTTCVLCHGDYKVDNIFIMIKDRKITELVPIDYQMAQFGHPLNDFFYFIFTSTDRKLRKNYLPFLKNLYYKSLTNFLSYFNIDIKEVYPKDVFEKDYKERMEVGLMMAIEVLPFSLAPDGEFPDFTKGLDSIKVLKQDSYIQRVNEVVEDFIDWRYL